MIKGNVVLEAKNEKTKVFDEDVAYIATNILNQTVTGPAGTAKYCAIPGITVAAKTGTTNDDYDRWLCGFTPYYTAVAWYGYDVNEEIIYSGTNPAGLLWSGVMKRIHSGLEPKDFNQPSGIVTATICADTGLCASETCANVYTEKFISGTVPEVCKGHQPEVPPQPEVAPEPQNPEPETNNTANTQNTTNTANQNTQVKNTTVNNVNNAVGNGTQTNGSDPSPATTPTSSNNTTNTSTEPTSGNTTQTSTENVENQ